MNAGPRILIVDDEPNIRDLLTTSLRFAGFAVRHRTVVFIDDARLIARDRLAGGAITDIVWIVADKNMQHFGGADTIQDVDTDQGARTLGELGIGTNYGIATGTREILLDEKIGGTIHMAIGKAYPESGGVNDSAVHWDMVCDLRQGGRITVDGEDLQVDGRFVV